MRTFKWARSEPLPDLIDVQPKKIPIDVKLGDDISINLVLTNISNSLVAFKIKTTAPERYLVRPTQGYLTIKETKRSIINLTKKPSFESAQNFKDKFLIQTVPIREAPNDLSEMWKEVESEHYPKNKMFAFHGQQLKCKLILPGDGVWKPSNTESPMSGVSSGKMEDLHAQETPVGEDLSRGTVQEPKNVSGVPSSPSHLKGKITLEDNLMDIDESLVPLKGGRQVTMSEYEYHEVIGGKEKYEKILSEVTSLTLDNQRLSKEIQFWKDRFLQEQSKRETFELEIQELRTRGTESRSNSQSNLRPTVTSNNSQEPPPISEMGLRRRSSFAEKAAPSSHHITDTDTQSERNKSRSQEDKSSDGPNVISASNSLDLAPTTGENKNNIHSRTNTRSRVQTMYTSGPFLIRSWFQAIIFALVFFILGRIFRS